MSQNCLVREKSHMFGDQSVRSEVFCVKVKDTQEEDWFFITSPNHRPCAAIVRCGPIYL